MIRIYIFCCFPDVARWVLNEQIVRNPSTGGIEYKYELIDDFNPDECEFAGPLIYFKHVAKTRRTQDQTDTPFSVNTGNGSYNNLGDGDSNRSGSDNYRPTEYDAYNHMLLLMVSSGNYSFTRLFRKLLNCVSINYKINF